MDNHFKNSYINNEYTQYYNHNVRLQPIYTSNLFVLGILSLVAFVIGVSLYLMFNSNNKTINEVNKIEQTPNQTILGTIVTNKCFNKVTKGMDNEYYWPDTCKGDPNLQMCFGGPEKLSYEDLNDYNNWVNRGKRNSELDSRCLINY